MREGPAPSKASRSWGVALALAAAIGSAALADDFDLADEAAASRTVQRDFLARLSSRDTAVRAKAADEVVGNSQHLEVVARGAADLDDAAWESFAAACTRSKREDTAVLVAAAARAALAAHRTRLLALARTIDPETGTADSQGTPAERFDRLLARLGADNCGYGYDVRIARLGRGAVPAILARIRESGSDSMLTSIAAESLTWTAEASDVPALRELLLAGKGAMARPLAALARIDVPGAADALLAALAAGRLDRDLAEALECVPDRKRTVAAVRSWIGGRKDPSADDRIAVARLCASVGAREMVPALETWLDAAVRPSEFAALGPALTRLGSPRGVETLVRMIGDAEDPTAPSDPSPLVLPPRGGERMCLRGFTCHERRRAAAALDVVAGCVVFPRADPDVPPTSDGGEPKCRIGADDRLVLAASAYRAWWGASKDRLRFDPGTARWSLSK